MNQIAVTGMVLSSVPVGEYDKRVVVLTKSVERLLPLQEGHESQIVLLRVW